MELIHSYIIKLNNKIIASSCDKEFILQLYYNRCDYYENLQKENKLDKEYELILFDLDKNCEIEKANFY